MTYIFRDSVKTYERACNVTERLPSPSNTQGEKSNIVDWMAGSWKKLINKLSITVNNNAGKLVLVGNDEVLSRGNRTETSDYKVAVTFASLTAGQFGRIHVFVAQTGTEVCSVDQSCIDFSEEGFFENVGSFVVEIKWQIVCGLGVFLFIVAFFGKGMYFSKHNANRGSGGGGGHQSHSAMPYTLRSDYGGGDHGGGEGG